MLCFLPDFVVHSLHFFVVMVKWDYSKFTGKERWAHLLQRVSPPPSGQIKEVSLTFLLECSRAKSSYKSSHGNESTLLINRGFYTE